MTSSYDAAVIGTHNIEDARLLKLPRGIRLLHLEATVWCKARRTDGVVPRGALPRLTDEPDAAAAAAELIRVGIWREDADGWELLDYASSQMSRQRVEKKEERSREYRDAYEERNPGRRRKPTESSGETVGETVGEHSRETSGEASASMPASLPARKGRKAGGRQGADSTDSSTSRRALRARASRANGAEGEVSAEILDHLRRDHPENLDAARREVYGRYAAVPAYAAQLTPEERQRWLGQEQAS